jgi:hypothetical protein
MNRWLNSKYEDSLETTDTGVLRASGAEVPAAWVETGSALLGVAELPHPAREAAMVNNTSKAAEANGFFSLWRIWSIWKSSHQL